MLFPNCFKAANASCIHASYIIHACIMHHASYIIHTFIMYHASYIIHHASHITHTIHHTYMHRASSTPCSKLGKGDKSSLATSMVMSFMHSVLLKNVVTDGRKLYKIEQIDPTGTGTGTGLACLRACLLATPMPHAFKLMAFKLSACMEASKQAIKHMSLQLAMVVPMPLWAAKQPLCALRKKCCWMARSAAECCFRIALKLQMHHAYMHHTSYIHAPCIIHHTSYVHASCTMHHAPYIIHHTYMHHTSYIHASCIIHHTSHIIHTCIVHHPPPAQSWARATNQARPLQWLCLLCIVYC